MELEQLHENFIDHVHNAIKADMSGSSSKDVIAHVIAAKKALLQLPPHRRNSPEDQQERDALSYLVTKHLIKKLPKQKSEKLPDNIIAGKRIITTYPHHLNNSYEEPTTAGLEILESVLNHNFNDLKDLVKKSLYLKLNERLEEIKEEISNDLFYEEYLDEASKEKLASYINKATSDYGTKVGQYMTASDKDKEKILKGVVKRKTGIENATEKLASGDYTGSEPTGMLKTIKDIRNRKLKEEKLDEISQDTLRSYAGKSSWAIARMDRRGEEGPKLDRRIEGYKEAKKRLKDIQNKEIQQKKKAIPPYVPPAKEDIIKKMNDFDVHYQMSDDPSQFRKGEAQHRELRYIMKNLSPEEKADLKPHVKKDTHRLLEAKKDKKKKISKEELKKELEYNRKAAEFAKLDQEI